MNLSLRTKLFLTLLAASTLTVVGMLGFMHWSFNNGMIELAETRQQERVNRIGERLVERYEEDGGWQRLAGDRRLWLATLHERAKRRIREHDFAGKHPPGGVDRRKARHPQHTVTESNVWPPTPVIDRARGPHVRPLRLEMRVMLLDADGEIIYGRPELLKGSLRFPLRLDDDKIGVLALIPGPFIPETGDLRFKERQTVALITIALGMILVSAVFAAPLSRRLSRPVLGFRDTARRLAGGDFGARVAVTGDDELGRLGRDINTLAETLERNEHARRRWVADISHELRTPLALLRAELEALQDGVRPLDSTAVDSLHGDMLRMGRLVDDLYELSMTDLGALSYRKEQIDPVEVLETDLDAFRARFAAADLGLQLDNRLTGSTLIYADEHRLSQLFRNLLGNSLQYTDSGGNLHITVDRADGDLLIDFEDTAPGVPSDSLPLLFDRLYRVDTSRSRNHGGAGLGLAIARNIVDAHGGTIEARASRHGGLAIRIQLPKDHTSRGQVRDFLNHR